MGTVDNEEKKKFLRGYRDSVHRIERIESEIDELRIMRTGASVGSGGRGRKRWKSDLSDYAEILDNLEEDLEKEREVRKQVFVQIRTAIGSLEDTKEQDVLFYRYIKSLSWWKIGEKMGYDERHVRRIHGWALSHLKIKDVLECPE